MKSSTLIGIVMVSASLTTVGCDQAGNNNANTNKPVTKAPTEPPKGDNTARNHSDAQPADAKTPLDQSNASTDVKITAEIRRAIMDDKAMSTNAQNCKIITDSMGVVTLRGPVATQSEKDAIESKAKAVAGVTRVVNELEVTPK